MNAESADPDPGAAGAKLRRSFKRAALIVVPALVVLGAGGYVYVTVGLGGAALEVASIVPALSDRQGEMLDSHTVLVGNEYRGEMLDTHMRFDAARADGVRMVQRYTLLAGFEDAAAEFFRESFASEPEPEVASAEFHALVAHVFGFPVEEVTVVDLLVFSVMYEACEMRAGLFSPEAEVAREYRDPAGELIFDVVADVDVCPE